MADQFDNVVAQVAHHLESIGFWQRAPASAQAALLSDVEAALDSAVVRHADDLERVYFEKLAAAEQRQEQHVRQQAQQAQQQAQQQQAQQQAPAANATPGNGAYAAAAGAAPAGGAPAAAMLSVQEYMASTPQQQMQHQAQLLQQQASALQAEQQRADAAAGQRGGAVPGQAWAWAAGGGVPGAAPGQMPPAPGQMMMMQGHAPPPPPPLSEPQGVQSERRKQRPQQQQQQQQQQSVPPYPGKSSLAQGQMQQSRAEQAAQERKEAQLSECTFKPQIRPLPSSYGTMRDKGVPFYDRVKRWQEHKKVEEDRIAKEQENAQLSECTFAPNINPNPDPTALDGSVAIAASQRLYKPKTVQKKDEVAAQAEQREKDEIARTCTFKPQINRSRTETPSAYKYWQHGQQVAASSATPLRHTAASTPGRAARAPKTPSAADPSCTFTPKINKPRPEMASAAVYLEANVFDRLSNPDGTKAAAGRENASDSAMNMHSFSSAAGSRGHSTPRRRPQSAGGAAGSAQKEKQFEDFHHRQQSRAKAREDNLRALRRHHTPSFKPDTPKAASAGPSGKNQALSQPFATRMHADLTRRNKRMLKEKMERSKDLEQCTFKPDISKSSAASGRREKRTPLEMSRGDMLKKETAHRLMKLKVRRPPALPTAMRAEESRPRDRCTDAPLRPRSAPPCRPPLPRCADGAGGAGQAHLQARDVHQR
jgi:hypothetical protein